MNSFVRVFICLAVVGCAVHAASRELSDDVVASYADAYQRYVVKFDKHYNSKEEYDKHLRAYAVCFCFFFFSLFGPYLR